MTWIAASVICGLMLAGVIPNSMPWMASLFGLILAIIFEAKFQQDMKL